MNEGKLNFIIHTKSSINVLLINHCVLSNTSLLLLATKHPFIVGGQDKMIITTKNLPKKFFK